MTTSKIKSILNEFCQKNRLGIPRYLIHDSGGPAHKPFFQIECVVGEFTVLGGHKSSKKLGEADAAEKMLLLLKQPTNDKVPTKVNLSTNVKVLIDYDNVPETLDWVIVNRVNWFPIVFLHKDRNFSNSTVTVIRSRTSCENATDIQLLLYAVKLLENTSDKVIIASKDKLFDSFIKECDNDNLFLYTNISELKKICKLFTYK